VKAALACVLVAAAAVLVPSAQAFANTEPFAAKQWYLTADHAWDYWPTMPQLQPVKVAVIDSGIDYGHPDFAGRIAAGRSFVPGSSWKEDTDGHGTFVAGEIAADPTNGVGIAGLAFNAQLLIAKVVKPDGSVSLEGEVAAIRWAVNEGARVINLSLGGVRDPVDLQLDTYSPLEQAAVEYAYSKGAVVVAAVGNGPESPATPWSYADYPAALPHVLGVGAIRQDGSVPQYSNRDAAYLDLAAPGDDIFSTIPRELVDTRRLACDSTPYSDCGPREFRGAIGTSFAAPQVAAAAALLFGVDPSLRPDQVSWLLERSAADVTAGTGCSLCPVGRDSFTGWGALDVDKALTMLASGKLPPPDRYEPNDDAGKWAKPLGRPRTIDATVDFWDDPIDVYRITLHKGERLYARLSPSIAGTTRLVLWKPGTDSVTDLRVPLSNEAAQATAVGAQQRLAFAVPTTGGYYVEVRVVRPTRATVAYTLALATTSPLP
jgi:subtilisin family serine protease